MKGITDRQKEVLDFISDFTEENVCPPTVREIGEHFGISRDNARLIKDKAIKKLKKNGSKRLKNYL